MGTPGFAVTTLAAIHGSKHQIVGVVTNVDKPAGRGKKISTSATVKTKLIAQTAALQFFKKLKLAVIIKHEVSHYRLVRPSCAQALIVGYY